MARKDSGLSTQRMDPAKFNSTGRVNMFFELDTLFFNKNSVSVYCDRFVILHVNTFPKLRAINCLSI